MILFIIALILCAIGLALIACGRFFPEPVAAASVGVLVALVGGGLILFDSYTAIPNRNVGIQTFGGRPLPGTFGPGYHWMAPWNDITKCDGSVQTLNLTDADHDAVTVRLGNQTKARLDVRLQWSLANDKQVVELFSKFRGCGNVQDLLIKGQLQHVLNDQFGTYDPFAAQAAAGDNKDVKVPTIDQLAAAARSQLQQDLGTAITVGTLTVLPPHYDDTTEARLHAFQQSIANTRIAQQDQETAKIQKATNDLLAASSASKDPGVQFQNCLSMLDKLSSRGQLNQLPVNSLQCVAGQGGGAPVIVGAK